MLLCALCAFMWLLCHQYYGVYDDAVLYSFQALAWLHPDLYAGDIFVRFGSQDSFTVFTPLYATLIEHLGLVLAGVVIVIFFSLWLLVATWWLARAMGSAQLAWLAVGLVIVVPASYGAFNVFKVGEEFVSARLPAEALLVTAVALSLHGRHVGALAVAIVGLLVHPLMALPVLAVLLLHRMPYRLLRTTCAASAVAILLLCAIAAWAPVGRVSLMDGAWLETVRLRSNYLFMTLWPLRTFERIVLVFCTLTIALLSLRDRRSSPLLRAAVVTLAGGLLVTLVSTILPVALLLQLQPWRVLWITTLLAIVVLPMIAVSCWRLPHGRGVVLLLASAWCLYDMSPHAAWLSAAAVGAGVAGQRLSGPALRYLNLFTWALAAITVIWALATGLSSLTMDFHIGSEPFLASRLRSMFGLPATAALTLLVTWLILVRARNPILQGLLVVATLAATPLMARVAEAQWILPLREHDMRIGFDDWRQQIPVRSEVLWMWDTVQPWMSLERPSYLSYAQASGVVFSRETSALIAARAERLRPLAPPEFVLGALFQEQYLPKTLDIPLLRHICEDPELGYVVSTDLAGTPLSTKEWPRQGEYLYLYDCGLTRQSTGGD